MTVERDTLEVVNPVAPVVAMKFEPKVITSLENKVIGILNNGWPSWNRFVDAATDLLKTKYGVSEVKVWQVPMPSAAPDTLLADAARECDLCFVGLGN